MQQINKCFKSRNSVLEHGVRRTVDSPAEARVHDPPNIGKDTPAITLIMPFIVGKVIRPNYTVYNAETPDMEVLVQNRLGISVDISNGDARLSGI